jgi:hypothetical protein
MVKPMDMGKSATKAAGNWIKETAAKAWGGGMKEAWTNMESQGGAWLARAAGGAAVGAATGMGLHAATGIAGIPTSALGLTENNMSLGGMLQSGLQGAMVGGAMGAGAVSSQGQLRGWAKNMIQGASAIAPKSMESLARNVPNAQIKGQVATGLGAIQGKDNFTNRMSTAGKLLWGGPTTTGASLAPQPAMQEVMNRMPEQLTGRGGDPMSRGLTGLAVGGMGFAAYSSNALGLGVPSNYGYR